MSHFRHHITCHTRANPAGWVADLKKWGWNEKPTGDMLCQFHDGYWDLENAFEGAGLNPHPIAMGGPNTCHRIRHWDDGKDSGPNGDEQYYNVDGTSYRVRSSSVTASFIYKSPANSTRRFHICHEQDRRW